MKPTCIILEGSWWKPHEAPLVLPYFQALAQTHGLKVMHRTFRTAEDLEFWIKKIPKGCGALLYIACHGSQGDLYPVGQREKISREQVIEALKGAKPGALEFLHFGCCEIFEPSERRSVLRDFAEESGAKWVSGFSTRIDWLRSTVLDMAMVAEVYCEFAKGKSVVRQSRVFFRDFDATVRQLQFSAVVTGSDRKRNCYPKRLCARN